MRVAVIGAGVSGITAAKCLGEAGIEPVVLEQGTEIGGIWRYDGSLPDGGGPAYRGLHTNTSTITTAFSDFPFPQHLPAFPPRAAMLQYLNDYADHFVVRERIRFGTEVTSVTPSTGGRWQVESRSSEGSVVEEFDAVVVGSGVFREPVLPAVPGLESFTGLVMHSRDYTVPDRFAGQRVVVVGSGSSATDASIEVSRVAREVYMSVRGMDTVVDQQGAATTVGKLRALRDHLAPTVARERLLRQVRLIWAQRVRGRPLGGPDAPLVLGMVPFTPSPKLREPLASGAVTLKPGIARIEGDTIMFRDGTSAEVDAIVFATGYALTFPFLEPAIFRPSMEGLDLYRLVFPPDWPTLAFVGMFRVSGPAPPVAEMQARWATQIFRGAVSLPKADEMRAAIAARRELVARTRGNPFRLNAEAYQDILASEIGALPRLWRHPRLAWALLAGPNVAAQYRLDGPGRREGAAATIKDAQRRPAEAVPPREEPAPVTRPEQA